MPECRGASSGTGKLFSYSNKVDIRVRPFVKQIRDRIKFRKQFHFTITRV